MEDGGDGVDKSEEVLESDLIATSQRIRGVLLVVVVDNKELRGKNDTVKEEKEEQEEEDVDDVEGVGGEFVTPKPKVLRLKDDVAVVAAAVAELSNPTVALLILL